VKHCAFVARVELYHGAAHTIRIERVLVEKRSAIDVATAIHTRNGGVDLLIP
jgi:hypothetical protein